MQLGRMHVIGLSFLSTPIFASKMTLKKDLNLGPLEPYAKSVDLQVIILKNKMGCVSWGDLNPGPLTLTESIIPLHH